MSSPPSQSPPWCRRSLQELYENSFDPDDYLQTYYGHLDAEVAFFLRNLHDFFASDDGTLYRDRQYKRRVSFVVKNRQLLSSMFPICTTKFL